MRYIITVLVQNHYGVLSKVSGLIARRGFNIESLAVGVTENPDISRMTIVTDCDENGIEQVEKQLNKLIPTIKVKVLEEGAYIARELTMVKVSCNAKTRPEIMDLAEIMRARIIDVTATSMTLELTDTTARTENFISLLKPFGIKELVRTGISAIELGANTTKK
ncbi:MAG: acetolactate synthase small subunit [Clostridia bacterium]|nr:acetolactate synthase small subunit [Clostridia bacterium]